MTEETLFSAFIPFGDIREIQLPKDKARGLPSMYSFFSLSLFPFCFRQTSETHRGYGFVEFEEEEDALHALENMDGSELHGKTLNIRMARSLIPQVCFFLLLSFGFFSLNLSFLFFLVRWTRERLYGRVKNIIKV